MNCLLDACCQADREGSPLVLFVLYHHPKRFSLELTRVAGLRERCYLCLLTCLLSLFTLPEPPTLSSFFSAAV